MAPMLDLRLSHVSTSPRLEGMTSVAVLGLGRMGTAIADRLSPHHDVRTWTRRAGGSPDSAVAGADVVLLCLYDGQACRDVLTACLASVSPTAVVVNTSTVGPDEAADLAARVEAAGTAYLHAPVLGSTPAVARGGLTILSGGKPTAEVEAVLSHLGETLVFGGAAEAAALKLVNNGVLGDSLASLRRALGRGEALGLPREAVLEVLARGALGRFVDGRSDVLGGSGARPVATFAVGALAKDLCLLTEATATTSDSASLVGRLLATEVLTIDDDISVVAAAEQDLTWLADARLDVSPEIVVDPDALRPLHAYALTHATGDPRHLSDAFLPTAHIEGYRDSEFSSWDLESFASVFTGRPAPDEATRSRRVESLDVRGTVATAVMTLHHGEVDFTDVFVLVRRPDGAWRIANKAYERRTAG
jgi:3-hydroxyisobutyrate dehydrogenase-like beta-hydroxyacid dehydrogenase